MSILDVLRYPIDQSFNECDLSRIPIDILAEWIDDMSLKKIHSPVSLSYIKANDCRPATIRFFVVIDRPESLRAQSLESLLSILYNK